MALHRKTKKTCIKIWFHEKLYYDMLIGFCDPYFVIHGSGNMHKNKIFDHKSPKPKIEGC